MAAVLSALAPYVLGMIKDIPEEELRMMLGVSGEIAKLGDMVKNLEAYVANAEGRRINDATVQRWVNKLKDALYEATDILELCQLEAEERRHKQAGGGCWATMEKKAPGCLLPLLFCLRNSGFAHGMGGRIKELNAGLDGIRKEMDDFRFIKLDPYPLTTAPSDTTPHSRTTTSLLNESAVVGDAIEADTNTLVQELLAKETTIKVVSITGAGGMGKTTLAKKIFHDRNIQGEFMSRIWLSVTESYNSEKLLTSAITQAGGGNDPHGDQQVLTQILASTLSAGKFLLVLDDVWSNGAWSDALQSPVLEAGLRQPESRVIITTRYEHLVKDMGATYHLHHVKPMCDEDAWSLLKKQLPPQDVGSESTLDRLKHIGIGIIKGCDGLPLAIKAIGGLLRTKRATEHEWKGVLDDSTWKTDKTHKDLNSALRLSYEDLSPPLKQCFLYYSLIPKGLDLHCDHVIGMWRSEGYLKVPPSNEGRWKEVEDIGICYYWDLITRNLIEQEEKFTDGLLSRMHDVIRSFALYMAKEEALLVVRHDEISDLLVSSTKFRRLSIVSTDLESESVILPDLSSIPEKQQLLRSLIITGRVKFEPETADSSLSMFPSLRALFVSDAESGMFVESLVKLKHLRFLHLNSTDISRLPDDIDKMKLLEHIHIAKCANFDGQIPSSILKLKHLRYLVIGHNDGTKFAVPKGLGGLTNLRILGYFPAEMDGEWCSLQELGPLSRLRTLYLRNLEAVPSGSLAAKAKIRDKVQLCELLLYCYGREVARFDEVAEEDCQRVEEVFDQLCPPPSLERLQIVRYIGRRPPDWMCMTSAVDLNSLIFLDLWRLPFCTQLPDSLCRLPSLEGLTIHIAPAIRRVGPEFQRQTASSMSGSLARTSFPRLQFLSLKVLTEWEEWEWEEEAKDYSIAMPALDTLYIFKCKLGHLPAGLASSRRLALRTLHLYDVARITAVENFPSVVELEVCLCPRLKSIRGLPRMQSVIIESCPTLKVLEGGSALDTIKLGHPAMETLPEYLRGLKPRILWVVCHQRLRDLLCSDDDSADEYRAEMDKLKYCGKIVVEVHCGNIVVEVLAA